MESTMISAAGRTYRVETRDSDFSPYTLYGTRGAQYALWRNRNKPEFLYVVNLRGMDVVDRMGWFTDKGGVLRAVTPLV